MLVLASNSPRRKQLLAFGGYSFSIIPAEIDERLLPPETPQEYVHRLAEAKARHIAGRLDGDTGTAGTGVAGSAAIITGAAVIAADTTVEYQGRLLGKPVDEREAEEMLRMLRAREHKVHTALAVLRLADQALAIEVCTTDVLMRDYSDDEITRYIATGDPLDKAGAYAIQHTGFNPVGSLQGCYTNVIGLPLCRLAQLLSRLGFPVPPTPFACLRSPQPQCSIPPELLPVDT